MALFSIVVPVYYNEESLPALYDRLNNETRKMSDTHFEFIFVDDGSQDRSFEILKGLRQKDNRVKVLKLSRNFGSFMACLAGLEQATGDCAAIIAADLQDPPELLGKLFEKWKNGSEIVCAVREKREENWLSVFFSNLYYKLFRFFAIKDMPRGGFDFVLVDRKIIKVLVETKEKNTTLMGQILWMGFKRDYVYYTKEKRQYGKSKWTFSKKIKYFIDSFMAFSYFPIRMISASGILIALVGFIFGLFAMSKRIFLGVEVPGFTTVIVLILFTAGVQMIMLGVIGEYLWRNIEEARQRPPYIVDAVIGFEKKHEEGAPKRAESK